MVPQLDHYFGRGVDGIEFQDDDETWEIILSGNVRVVNHDSERVAPTSQEIGGLAFTSAIFSELDTRMLFGVPGGGEKSAEVTLTPTKYEIKDPEIGNGPHFPQRAPEQEGVEEVAEEEPVSAPEVEEEPEAVEEQDEEEKA